MSFGLGQIGSAGRLGRPRLNGGIKPPAWVIDPSVSLDIDFMNDRSFIRGQERDAFSALTVARTTIGAYYDVNGILQFAPAGTPRIDYHPATQAKLGLLSEQAIGNYCLRSNEFNDAAWTTRQNVTITPAAAIGPDGLMSATKIEATAATNSQVAQTCIGAGNASGNTFSVYVKRGSGGLQAGAFTLRNETTATNVVNVSFNYDTGAIGAGGVAIPLPNGWYRIVLSSPIGISTNDNLRVYVAFNGGLQAGGEFAYVYGAQLERQVFATSYFPTVAAVAFRAADNLDIAVTGFTYSALGGTLLSRFKSQQAPTTAGSVNAGCGLYIGGDATNAERLNLYYYAQIAVSTRMGSNGRTGDVSQWDLTRGLHGTQYLNGHVDRVTYWPYRKSDAQLVALSA